MKRITVLFMVVCLALSACGNSEDILYPVALPPESSENSNVVRELPPEDDAETVETDSVEDVDAVEDDVETIAEMEESPEETANASQEIPLNDGAGTLETDVADTPLNNNDTIVEMEQEPLEESVVASKENVIDAEAPKSVTESEAGSIITQEEPIPITTTEGNVNNFDTYNFTERQDAKKVYILNNNSKKIHNPHCSSVPKIAPENYEESTLSLEELEASGYTKCKQKGDWN